MDNSDYFIDPSKHHDHIKGKIQKNIIWNMKDGEENFFSKNRKGRTIWWILNISESKSKFGSCQLKLATKISDKLGYR